MVEPKASEPKTLADKPIADRRGDDVLDRHVHHVIDHPADEAAEEESVISVGEDHHDHHDHDGAED